MSLLFLIRHGQASFGADNYDSLSATGARQSELLADYFSSSGLVFDLAFSGSMQRQQDTAGIVISRAPGSFRLAEPEVLPELDEHDSSNILRSQLPGILEEDPSLSEKVKLFFEDREAFNSLFTRAMRRWVSGEHDVPGVETFREFNARAGSGLEKILEKAGEGERIAVFTSGGVIAAIVQLALALPDEKAMRLPWWTRNASVSVARHSGGNIDLLAFNSTAHLEMEGTPELLTYK